MDLLGTLGAALGLAMLAGINLYLTMFITGLAVRLGWFQDGALASALAGFGHPAVIAVALTSLFMAFDRGRVGLVAPLTNAMQSVVVVALGALIFGARERTTRILLALVLVGIGGALITGS